MTEPRDPVRIALLVYLGLVIALVLIPILFVFVYAFSSVSYATFPPPGLSLRWFVKLFEQTDLIRAAMNSLIVATVATALSLVFGTMASVALVRYRFRGREVLRAAFLSPLVVPRIAFGIGMLVYVVILRRFGGLDSIILAHLMLTLPFTISIMSASLVNADRAVEEAAMDLGATAVGAFWRVTIPQLRTGLAVSTFFAFIISWDQVESTLFLVKPGNITLPVAMFFYILRQYDPVIAALSALQVVLAFVVGTGLMLLLNPKELHSAVGEQFAK
jgi:putative spermidine/putrescine transport system permease protein